MAQETTDNSTSVMIAGRSLWSDARRRLMRDKSAMICFAVIVLYALVSIGGVVYDIVAERSEDLPTFAEMADPSKSDQPPSFESWKTVLGTDWYGKPIIIKTLLGAKVSMSVGLIANIIAVPLGMILGAIAGYYGRWIDSIIVWMFSTLMSIPGLVLLIAIKYAFTGVTIWGLDLSGIHGVYIALGIISWIGTCRLVRAETMKIRELDYVVAARASGACGFVILLRHVIPNVLHLGIINFSLGFVGAIKAEVMLSYLGLGVEPGVPSWGSMINAARLNLYSGKWWELTAAVGAMFFLVLALNIFGDRLRDAFDPKLKTA
jgi:peptide/nickel transport system permease protein